MSGYPEVDEALTAWGIQAVAVEPLRGGAVNEHWRIDTSLGGRWVLRRYAPRHVAASTQYEHDVLAFLALRDWPVAPPVSAEGIGTVVETEAGRWALFPFMPGAPAPDDALFLQRKGALLALLHDDLDEWDAPGQRPGFGRVIELDIYLRPHGFDSFEALIERYRRGDPARADALEGYRRRNLQAVGVLGYDALPDVPVYNECFANNVLFEGDDVTAILDFDFVHLDARVADIGRSLVVDCGADPERVQRWMLGYAAHASPRVSTAEASILPAMMLANEIWNTALPLAISSYDSGEWLRDSVRVSIDRRLPSLEAAQRALRRAIRQVGGVRG
jgi:Ser/Thr protein kinase RdoA (MazF antagonist)